MIYLFNLLFFLSVNCFPAPYPATSSSYFLNRKENFFLWPFGIDLNLRNTSYEIDMLKNDSEKWSVYVNEPGIQISIRIRKIGPKEDYDKSLKNWIREYEKSGFQVISQQIPKKNAESGWIHLQNSQEKQLVQYFRYKERLWVYFNCVGEKDKLIVLKKDCEQLNSLLKFR